MEKKYGEKMRNEEFMGEYELYQNGIIQTMSDYGLICEDEVQIMKDYLFKVSKTVLEN